MKSNKFRLLYIVFTLCFLCTNTSWLIAKNSVADHSFLIPPAGVSGTLITMTAANGSDVNGKVDYFFTETSGNPGGSSSGWQRNPNFRDGDLQPLTEYTYTLTIRDASGNVGKTSNAYSVTTPEYIQFGKENELEYGAYYGYQGWHFTPGDDRQVKHDWQHWFNHSINDSVNVHGDMWPDLREYNPDNLYETNLDLPNGEKAKVYSCHDYSTIDLHVKWMKEYGIKGCVVQRFTGKIDSPFRLEQNDKKVLDIMTACEKYGVKFWIMHDSGGNGKGVYQRVSNDWKHLVDDLDILQSPAYAYQNGLPVYGLWGMGVQGRKWTPQTVLDLLDFYQDKDSDYRAYVVGGIATLWFKNRPEGWTPVYERLDMLSPWRTLFYQNASYKQTEIDRMYAEKAWCDERGIDFLPVVAPGNSAGNIGLYKGDIRCQPNNYPRNGGHLLWKQVYEVCKMDRKFMYIAMYDEIDEGTAMYKMAATKDDLPINCRQIALDEDGYDLPGDWYLQLGDEIQKMMDGRIPVSEKMSITPKKR